jgi:hypothetical protein
MACTATCEDAAPPISGLIDPPTLNSLQLAGFPPDEDDDDDEDPELLLMPLVPLLPLLLVVFRSD